MLLLSLVFVISLTPLFCTLCYQINCILLTVCVGMGGYVSFDLTSAVYSFLLLLKFRLRNLINFVSCAFAMFFFCWLSVE